MDRSTELRIPTTTVAVRVALGDQVIDHAELFVLDEPRRSRFQLLDAIAALLETAAQFVPVRTADGIRLVNKAHVRWIVVRAEPSADATDEPLYDRQHRVRIELVHGAGFEGLLLDSAPSDRPRVIDHLNHPSHFVRLWTAEDHVLINKTEIATVAELPEAG
ncbi:MAG TPA: hypothetical protein VFQ53_12065 [Kofleriaceae bacterium]|nr:hypothetical protein [Kofleriaceae bacterium]